MDIDAQRHLHFGRFRRLFDRTRSQRLENQTTGQGILIEAFDTGSVDPSSLAYAGLGYAWKKQSADQFNQLIVLYTDSLSKRFESALKKCSAEVRFNASDVFAYERNSSIFWPSCLAIVSWLRLARMPWEEPPSI